jgi:glucuronokinase
VPVFMDFSAEFLKRKMGLEVYRYVPLPASLLPPLYVAYRADLSEPTERAHSDVRERYYRGDAKVVEVMGQLARLTSRVRELIEAGKGTLIGPYLDENFDLRCEIYNVSEGNRQLVAAARRLGCSAKLAGSGGAIIGTCPDEATYARLVETMRGMDCCVIKPLIGGTEERGQEGNA